MRQIVRQRRIAPIQLWLPTFTANLSESRYQRDARRAMGSWTGESRVWLLPGLKKEARWFEPIGDGEFCVPVLAIPSEHLNRLDVYHIGETGAVWGIEPSRFPDSHVDGLLDAWLNLFGLDEKVTYDYAPEAITLRVPRIQGLDVTYEDRELHRVPGPTFPITEFEKESRHWRFRWPPDSGHPAPISPDAESSQYYGPMKPDREGQVPIAISERDPKIRSLQVIFRLPKPFERLISYGVGMDMLYGHVQMRELAQQSARSAQGVSRKAKDAAAPYLTEGQTSRALAWLFPTLVELGVESALRHVWLRLNLPECREPKELLRPPVWQEAMVKLVPIRRAWGLLGLCWALLLDELEDGRKFGACERCGQVFRGKHGKQFCGPEDDKSCYRDRRASDRRRERNRGEAHEQETNLDPDIMA